jgi:predicted O-linked N-acetylglucosamine transferase (SPINDLY family)
MDVQNSVDIQFNPRELLQDYANNNYDLLSEKLLQILNYFDRVTYTELTDESRYFINAFVKSFLYIFTQLDYILNDRDGLNFIKSNLTISNLVAISDFRTTDPYLELLTAQPQNYVKLLTLYSARNIVRIDRQMLFNTNIELASHWYSHYLELYRSGLVNRVVYENLREHILYEDDRLTEFYHIDNLYFGATYIDGECDRILKQKINRSIQNSQLVKSIQIENKPDPNKIAIVSGCWFPQHSVYRILSEYVATLADKYELTLIHLGDRHLPIDTTYFKAVKYLKNIDSTLDLSEIKTNEFAAIYFPDIGMIPESILLANLRIAPIQICGLGHPVSTFGSKIDYFISGGDAEVADNPQLNYSERLVLLPGTGAIHKQPNYQIQNEVNNRSPKLSSNFIINCPWYAQKVNYPLLLSLQQIATTANKHVLFRIFAGGGLTCKNDFLPFVRDIERIVGAEHVCVYPYQSYDKYMDIMAEGDICLDAYHFGGCNVIVDGLYLHKPTVVFEGDRWYSRAGAKLMRKIGLGELVATTPLEYVSLTLKSIDNDEFRAEIQTKIDAIDLDKLVFESHDAKYFQKAIEFLLQNHAHLQADATREPIWIPRSSGDEFIAVES